MSNSVKSSKSKADSGRAVVTAWDHFLISPCAEWIRACECCVSVQNLTVAVEVDIFRTVEFTTAQIFNPWWPKVGHHSLFTCRVPLGHGCPKSTPRARSMPPSPPILDLWFIAEVKWSLLDLISAIRLMFTSRDWPRPCFARSRSRRYLLSSLLTSTVRTCKNYRCTNAWNSYCTNREFCSDLRQGEAATNHFLLDHIVFAHVQLIIQIKRVKTAKMLFRKKRKKLKSHNQPLNC